MTHLIRSLIYAATPEDLPVQTENNSDFVTAAICTRVPQKNRRDWMVRRGDVTITL
jgi:hypothetical protein